MRPPFGDASDGVADRATTTATGQARKGVTGQRGANATEMPRGAHRNPRTPLEGSSSIRKPLIRRE